MLDDNLQDDDESDSSDDPLESLELVSGISFTSWNEFRNWIDRFALKEGFNYKIRTSEKDHQGVMRRATYECSKSSSHNLQVTSDPTKRRDAQSSRVSCP